MFKKLMQAGDVVFCQRINIHILYWFFRYAPHLSRFKDLHKGEDCFIMGNGPSLNKIDLTQLNDYHIFGLNKIHLLLKKIPLNLSYHVAVNPFVIQQSKQHIESLSCPSFLSYISAKDSIRKLPHIHFLATGGRVAFSDDLMNVLGEGWTVTYVALQLAYYMGFKRVFLVGVDHNFKVKGNPNETQHMKEDDSNHFDPNYFKGQQWQLPDLEGSELSYHMARFYYERDNRKIYDATEGGKLTIYEKISFEEALTLCRKKAT